MVSAEWVLERGRIAAEALMVDTIRIERLGGLITDPVSGEVRPGRELVYEGRCKVQSSTTLAENPEAGGGVFTVERTKLHLPALTSGVEVGLVGTVLSAPHQPALVGNEYRLAEPDEKSWQTAQRWSVERVA